MKPIRFLSNVVKSNGLLITFPLMWLVIALRDVTKGQVTDAALEIVLAMIMLAIPSIVNRVRQKPANEIIEFAFAVDNLKEAIWNALPQWLRRLFE